MGRAVTQTSRLTLFSRWLDKRHPEVPSNWNFPISKIMLLYTTEDLSCLCFWKGCSVEDLFKEVYDLLISFT